MTRPACTTQLFLKIHSYVGKWPFVDRAMVFAAHYLLFILIAVLLHQWWRTDTLPLYGGLFGVYLGTSLAISYMIALVWYRPRPVRQIPGFRALIKTLGTWKSFPSDHTIAATIVGYAGIVTFSGWALVIFLILSASIAFSRVWVGVHYPRDILGGFFLALGVILALS